MARLMQFLIAIDQALNALAGGWADETLSSRAWREQHSGWVRLLDAAFGFDHCRQSYISERQRMQMPPELRT